ncbi:MAG: tripartite tricarboxylate transporter TctB family protein [Betaproteobacteria bacterium]|nr:tripartite tricarboxylate transporter TctB family protein [Betaproteobacteria bacterium]
MADLARRLGTALPVAALGVAAILLSRDFPPVPGQTYGPGLFPAVLGWVLTACALGVALQPAAKQTVSASSEGRLAAGVYALAPAVLLAGWESAGWPILSFALGSLLLGVGRVRWWRCLLGGGLIAVLTWVLFPLLLRVPLPRGPLPFIPY